jgi:CheY-like chemotaxis protein
MGGDGDDEQPVMQLHALGQLAHDFNNVLQAVKLELTLLHGSAGDPAKVRGHVEEIRAALDRGAVLSRQLLVLSRQPAAGAAASPPTRETPRGSERILVVEDDATVRRAFTALLEDEGYVVVDADCGPAALATWDARDGAFDLVLTDLIMPGGLNGKELAALFVARRRDIKIIIATGHGRDLDKAALGPNYELLFKPVEAERLLAAVRASLAK